MMKITKESQGFTLIELLIVIAIIIMMLGLIMTNYIGFAERQRVRSAAEEAQNFLADIQNRARMGHRGTGCCSIHRAEDAFNNPLENWTVQLWDNVMLATPRCGDTTCNDGWGDTITVHLPPRTRFAAPEGYTIFFPALYGNPTGQIYTNIIVTDNNNNYNFCFQITRGGAVTIGDFC